MRRPAAVSGTYGNRPSQGIMNLDGAIPLSWPQDTAGVFSRDPQQWTKFARAWYGDAGLHEGPNITGLSPLVVPFGNNGTGFPKHIIIPDEYFPLPNPSAQSIVNTFLSKVNDLFGINENHINLTSTVANASMDFSDAGPASELDNWTGLGYATDVLNTWSQRVAVAEPLVSAWAQLYNGRFPPIDPEWRESWTEPSARAINETTYEVALALRRAGVSWFESNLLYETEESCSESIMLCDIGTGGLPSFRERDLNDRSNASFLAVVPPGAAIACANICPYFG